MNYVVKVTAYAGKHRQTTTIPAQSLADARDIAQRLANSTEVERQALICARFYAGQASLTVPVDSLNNLLADVKAAFDDYSEDSYPKVRSV